MAPNRKTHAIISQEVASLRDFAFTTTSKFPALTEQQQQTEAAAVQSSSSKAPAADTAGASSYYWEWPTPESLPEILVSVQEEEESMRALFSADRITANLVVASARLLQANTNHHADCDKNDNDDDHIATTDYWCMPASASLSKHPDVVVNNLTSAEHVQANLIQAAAAAATAGPAQNESLQDENQAYWEWPAWKVKERSVQQLRRQELERQMVSSDHVIETLILKSQQQQQPRQQNAASATTLPLRLSPSMAIVVNTNNNDDYWAF